MPRAEYEAPAIVPQGRLGDLTGGPYYTGHTLDQQYTCDYPGSTTVS